MDNKIWCLRQIVKQILDKLEDFDFFPLACPLYIVMQMYTCLKNNLDQFLDEKIKNIDQELGKNQLDVDGKLGNVSSTWQILRKYETSICRNDIKNDVYDDLSMDIYNRWKSSIYCFSD